LHRVGNYNVASGLKLVTLPTAILKMQAEWNSETSAKVPTSTWRKDLRAPSTSADFYLFVSFLIILFFKQIKWFNLP
jgi:hypothetical protein